MLNADHIFEIFSLPLKNPILVFSVVLFIILMAPLVFRRLNIPGIIVLILSGVLVGPHGFNVLQQNSAVELFSTIGLLYIMFIAGLDLELNEFKINKHKSILFGFFTFSIPLALGYPVCHYLLGYSEGASLLTASMFATHTLISYPIVNRFGISKNQAVAVAVGGTILTDTVVLILLAVIIGKSNGSLNMAFGIRLVISLAVLFFLVFKIFPLIAKWFFKKLESEKHSHYIFVLAVLFLSAFLAEIAGIEPIIGAFTAGLALNKLIPHSSALMNRIEFIGNSLFIPFFLISVGMLVDLSIIFQGYTALIVAGLLTVTALFGKWIAAFFTQLILRYSSAERQLIFGLSSSHAAATLAIILVGYQAGILDENVLNGTIILILITCIVSSIVTEKAAKKIVASTNFHLEAQKSLKFKNERILIPISLEANIEKMLDFAQLIKEKKSSTPITILKVIPNNEDAELEIVKTRAELSKYAKHTSASENLLEVVATIDYNISGGIIRSAKETLADFLIIGWPHHVGIINKFIGGSSLENIISQIDKTVIVCKISQAFVAHERIVLLLPPLGEKEYGFNVWFSKVMHLSIELSLPVVVLCDSLTKESLTHGIKKSKSNQGLKFVDFDNWEDFGTLGKYVKPDDLFVMASARKGSTSYMNYFENSFEKLDKVIDPNSKIIIYPQQYASKDSIVGMGNLSTYQIEKGLEEIQKISKNITNIFKK